MPLSQRLSRYAGPLALLLCATLLLYATLEALGPRGFSFRDESICYYQALSYRLGFPWVTSWANGNLLKFFQFSLYSLTGSFQSLHFPALFAIVVQAGALYFVGKYLGGHRVAQGAMLASLLSATALVQSRSLLPFATLPCLLAISVALCLKKPSLAFFGGLIFACGFLDYEGTAFAIPGAVAFLFFEPKLKRSSAWTWSFGFVLGLCAVLWFSRHSIAEWWTFRMAYNRPFQATLHNPLPLRFWQWFFGGSTEPYMAVSGHGTFPLWALPLALGGLVLQTRRRPWLLLWTIGSLLALIPASEKLESQRAFSALIPLAIAAGFGWRWLWHGARTRTWLALLALTLPLWGFAQEIKAFEASMQAGQSTYARSQVWRALSRDPSIAKNVNAALLPIGLTLECALGSALDPSSAEFVWVPSDLDRDAPLCPSQALHYPDDTLTGDLLLSLSATHPLRQDLVRLRPFWLEVIGRGSRIRMMAACRSALQENLVHTSLAREALWDKLLDDAIQIDHLTVDDLKNLDHEDFHSPFFYRARMIYTWPKDLRLTRVFCALLAKHCGRDRLAENERQLLAIPWAQVPARPGSPNWPN